MKKILISTLLSIFIASSAFAGCTSCRRSAPAPQQPAQVFAPVVANFKVINLNSRIVTVTSPEHFQSLVSSGNVIVKFGASWCKPCERLSAELEKIAENCSAVKVVYVDTDAQKSLTYQNSISSLPTMHFYKNGVRIGAPVMGFKTEAQIKIEFGL